MYVFSFVMAPNYRYFIILGDELSILSLNLECIYVYVWFKKFNIQSTWEWNQKLTLFNN